jgi:hypothetical protein
MSTPRNRVRTNKAAQRCGGLGKITFTLLFPLILQKAVETVFLASVPAAADARRTTEANLGRKPPTLFGRTSSQRRPVATSGGGPVGWRSARQSTGYGASTRPEASSRTRSAAIAQRTLQGALQRCRKEFTVRGLVDELAERALKVDYRTMWELVHAEKLSYKKDAYCRRAGSSRCRPSASAMDQVSESDRSHSAGVYRRDLDKNQHGAEAIRCYRSNPRHRLTGRMRQLLRQRRI